MAEQQDLEQSQDALRRASALTDPNATAYRTQMGQYEHNIAVAGEQQKLSAEEQQRILDEQEKAAAPKREAASAAIAAQEKNLGNVPDPPTLEKPPKITSFFDKDVGTMLLSAASIIAGVGVGNGKVRGIRAMNALAGGIHGYIKGDLQSAYMGLEDYRNNMEQQIEEYKMMFQKNKEIIEQGGKTIEGRLNDLELTNAPFKNKLLSEAINQKNIQAVIDNNMNLADLATKAQVAIQKINPVLEQLKIGTEQAKQLKLNAETRKLNIESGIGAPGAGGASYLIGNADATGQTHPEALQGADPSTAAIVKQLAEYRIPLPSGFALRSPFWQRVIGLASQYDPSFDASQYSVRMKLRNDFASGKAAANIRSLNTAVNHLNTLKRAADALDNSPIQLWNKIANTGITHVGDPRVTNFNTAATAVESELATVFKGTAGTDQEIKAWRNGINDAQSPEQLRQGINQAIELMSGRVHALASQYETGMGKPKDFKMLSEGSREILTGLGIDPNEIDPTLSPGEPGKSTQPTAPTLKHGTSKSGKPMHSSDGIHWEYD